MLNKKKGGEKDEKTLSISFVHGGDSYICLS